jgi:Spy/CpxP family protein refolding chaperone
MLVEAMTIRMRGAFGKARIGTSSEGVDRLLERRGRVVDPTAMRAKRWVGGIVPAISIVLCQACHGNGTEDAAPSASASAVASAATVEAGPPPKPRVRAPRHGGIAATLFHDAHELDLAQPQQDGMQAIEASLKTADDGVRAAMKAFRGELAAGVKAGKLETAKLTADETAVDKALADHAAAEATALDSLHGLLTAGQRTALVNGIQTRQADRETRMLAWLKTKEPDGGPPDWNRRRVDRLSAQLALDPAQQKQLAAILAKTKDPPNADGFQSRWEEHKKRADAVFTAFAADPLDAKKLELATTPGKTSRELLDHIVAFVNQLLPVLHPDQRDRLASILDRPLGASWAQRAAITGPMGMGPPMVRDIFDDIAFPFAEPPPTREDREGAGVVPMPPLPGLPGQPLPPATPPTATATASH